MDYLLIIHYLKLCKKIDQRRFYFSKHRKKLWEILPQMKKNQQMTTTFKKTV